MKNAVFAMLVSGVLSLGLLYIGPPAVEAANVVQQDAIGVQHVATRVRTIERLGGQVIDMLPASYRKVRVCVPSDAGQAECADRLVLEDVVIVWRGPERDGG